MRFYYASITILTAVLIVSAQESQTQAAPRRSRGTDSTGVHNEPTFRPGDVLRWDYTPDGVVAVPSTGLGTQKPADSTIKFTAFQPLDNTTYWVEPGRTWRVLIVFVMAGKIAASGSVNVVFYDDEGEELHRMSHPWTRGEKSTISGAVPPGNYSMEMMLPLPAVAGRKPVMLPIRKAKFQVAEAKHVFFDNVPQQFGHKDFIYLVQHHESIDLSELRTENSDALLLVWKNKPPDSDIYPHGWTIWAPNTTLTEGRNLLLSTARSLTTDGAKSVYQYFIMRDGDCELRERKDYGRNTGHPWRTFENYLSEWEPAVGFVSFDWQQYDQSLEVQLGYNFDQILVAFHHETLGSILPYTTRWVNESWHHCGRMTSLLSAAFHNEHRIQFNALEVFNSEHTRYTAWGNYEKPLIYVLGALRNETQLDRLWFTQENYQTSVERSGVPRKRSNSQVSYRLAPYQFNACHPLFRDNPYFEEFYPNAVLEHTSERCARDVELWPVMTLGMLQRASNTSAVLQKRVSELEDEVAQLKKQMQSLISVVTRANGGRGSSSALRKDVGEL